jgi:hypothetical protein
MTTCAACGKELQLQRREVTTIVELNLPTGKKHIDGRTERERFLTCDEPCALALLTKRKATKPLTVSQPATSTTAAPSKTPPPKLPPKVTPTATPAKASTIPTPTPKKS